MYRDDINIECLIDTDGPWMFIFDEGNADEALDGIGSSDDDHLNDLADRGIVIGVQFACDGPNVELFVDEPLTNEEKGDNHWAEVETVLLDAPTGRLHIGSWGMADGEEESHRWQVEPGVYAVVVDRLLDLSEEEERRWKGNGHEITWGVLALRPISDEEANRIISKTLTMD